MGTTLAQWIRLVDVRAQPSNKMHDAQNVEDDLYLMRAIAVNWVTSESCYTFFLSASYSFFVVVVAVICLLPYRFDDQIKFYFPIFLCERLSARFGDCTAIPATKTTTSTMYLTHLDVFVTINKHFSRTQIYGLV